MDEQIEQIARAIAEADGIVLPTHATVHMLAAGDGWAVAKRYERLGQAAHSVMSGTIAELKSSVIAFAGPWAVEWANLHELPKGHLHPDHYDLLKECGARMDDFTRAALAPPRRHD